LKRLKIKGKLIDKNITYIANSKPLKMRKISLNSILVFNGLIVLVIALALLATRLLLSLLPLGDFTGVVYAIAFLLFLYLSAILAYRLFLKFYPLLPNSENSVEIPEGSKQEFIYHVYLLFYLMLFLPLMNSRLIPITFMRAVYQMLGAKLGANTYCSGLILDPPFTEIGDNTLLGQDCILTCHVIEGKRLAFNKIQIGNHVTIGAKAVIMAGVIIEDRAIVGAGAVVTKGTKIQVKEVWGGVPAKKIKTLS